MEYKTLIEVCVDAVESALAAEAGGADRVELCDNLMEGGTTPSFAAMEIARAKLRIGMHVIIRPRGGDFLYSDLEFEIMRRDIEIARRIGVDGIVVGVLTENGEIDLERTAALLAAARPLSVTFHRAFDVCRDPFAALESLISIGVDRILTSGQEPTAFEGLDTVRELVERAGKRIVIMGCGGLRAGNVRRFVEATGVREVHLTGFAPVESGMIHRNERIHMGGTLRPPEFVRGVTSSRIVENVRKQLA